MALNYVQTNTLYLSGSGVIIGATSISLTSLTDIYGNVLTMADFGSAGYITLEPNTTNEEAALFTGITANANGTYTLTGVQTVLAKSPYTASSGLTRPHAGGTSVVVSDSSAFWSTFANKQNNETITGSWTFNTAPVALSATPASTTALGNVKLSVAPSTNLGNPTISIASPAVITLTSHGLIAGDSIQLTTTGTLPTGLLPSTTYYVIAAGLTANAFQVAATVGGAAINTSGSQSGTHTLIRVTPLAVGNDDTRVPSVATTAALAGSAGTPSSTNKFLTQSALYADIDQSQTTEDTLSVVGAANSTNNRNQLAQSFIPVLPKLRGFRLYKGADTGSFTGNVTIALQASSAGNPSGSNLASVTIPNATWLLIPSALEFEADFADFSVTPGTSYWIVISTSTADTSNHPNIGYAVAGGYGNGLMKSYNVTDGWTTVNNASLYFKTLPGSTTEVAATDATNGLVPTTIAPSGLIDFDASGASAGPNSTTTAYTKVLPISAFRTAGGIRITAYGSATSGGAQTSTLSVKLNGTVAASISLNSASGSLWLRALITNNNALGSQIAFLETLAGTTANQSVATYTIDTSKMVVLQVTVATSNVGGSSTTYAGCYVEKLSK